MINRMTLSWGANFVKYLLFAVNFVFVITGIIILSVGASIKAYYDGYSTFLDTKYFSTPNLLIAIGVIVFFVAFFGCCGAFKENFCMVVTFSTLLILIFILELAAGIAGYALRNATANYLSTTLLESMEQYNTVNDTTSMWDLIQKEFECCGAHNYEDWSTINGTDGYIPISCCSPQNGAYLGIVCTTTESAEITIDGQNITISQTPPYEKGCVESFGDFVSSHAVTLGGVGIAIAMIQLIGIGFSCFLSKKLREQQLYS